MKTISINLYKFSELSPAARDKAWLNNQGFCEFDGSDYKASLAAFEKIFDIRVYDYTVGNWIYFGPRYHYVTSGAANEAPDGDPLRLARFIWNNYADYITKGKYYSTPGKWVDGKYKYKHRHSKVFLEMDNCPLTGFCADTAILQPVIDCLHYKRFFNSYDELIQECLDNFFSAWDSEIEYYQSYEYFEETAEENEMYFTADGELYKGA